MANALFKQLKGDIDGFKQIIAQLRDRKSIVNQIHCLQREMLAKSALSVSEEIRLKSLHDLGLEEMRASHL